MLFGSKSSSAPRSDPRARPSPGRDARGAVAGSRSAAPSPPPASRRASRPSLLRVVTAPPPIGRAPQMQEERHEVVVPVARVDRTPHERPSSSPGHGNWTPASSAASSTRSRSFSSSAVVNVAEKSSRRSGSVLYLTNGAPAAELPITSSSAVRGDAGRLPEHERLGHQLRQSGDHEVDRELHDPSLLAVADVVDGGADRAEDRLDPFERRARARDDEAQVAGAHDRRVSADRCAQIPERRVLRERGDPGRGGGRDGAQCRRGRCPAAPRRRRPPRPLRAPRRPRAT